MTDTWIEKDTKTFLLNDIKNIVKSGKQYDVQNAYMEDGDGNVTETPDSQFCSNPDLEHRLCEKCSNHVVTGRFLLCDVAKTVTGIITPCAYIRKCAAYNPVERLNIIKTELDMIHFIEKTESFFGSPEDCEEYYGFDPQRDENTEKISETVREYYNRGGRFGSIPTEYPSVICFDPYCSALQWISIKDCVNS